MSNYRIAPDARTDIREIWEYISEDNPLAADRLVDRFFDAFEKLARMPGMGHKREDVTTKPYLFWPMGTYIVIYRIFDQLVEILAVIHGARDIPAFLARRLKH